MVDQVIQACEACYDAHIGDCSGFARAVADRVGIVLEGNADAIADLLEAESGGWTKLAGGPAAAAAAACPRPLGGIPPSLRAAGVLAKRRLRRRLSAWPSRFQLHQRSPRDEALCLPTLMAPPQQELAMQAT